MGKTGQHRHQDWFFFLSQKNKKANERAIINGLLCWQFPLHTIKLDVGIAFFYAIFYLILCLFDSKSMGLKETAEHLFLVFSCFFKILNQGTFFSTLLSQQRHQTKCGILEQIHVCVAFVLSVVNCQGFLAKEEEKKRRWLKTTLASYTRPSGYRSEGFWIELSALFGFFEQHACKHTMQLNTI